GDMLRGRTTKGAREQALWRRIRASPTRTASQTAGTLRPDTADAYFGTKWHSCRHPCATSPRFWGGTRTARLQLHGEAAPPLSVLDALGFGGRRGAGAAVRRRLRQA